MTYTHTNTGSAIELKASANGSSVPVAHWLAHATGAASMVVARLLTLVDSGDASLVADDVLSLPNAQLVELPEHEALALGLPQRSAYTLTVEHKGIISEPGFRINWRLNRADGLPVVNPKREGAIVRVGSTSWRLPSSHFHLMEAAECVSAAMSNEDLDDRLRAYATLRQYLPETGTEGVRATDLLRQFQVYDAGAFSLRLRIQQGKLSFDPVLYARKPGPTAEHELLAELEPTQLLSDASSEAFAGMLEENTGRYALGGNRFLVLSPNLIRAMTTVKRLRDGNDAEAQRRLFLQPAAVLHEAFASELGDEGLEDVLGSLFLETKAYLSDRVIGIGIWKKPVLPWIKKKGNSWFPPEVEGEPPNKGIRIETADGPVDLPITKAEAERLREVVAQAQQEGSDFVEHAGQRIPATDETLKALRTVSDPPQQTPRGDPEAKMALLIDGHYEAVTHAQGLSPRQPLTSATLPAGLRTGMKEHQLVGLRWLQDAWRGGMPGVLLADDMGLGKTLQALAFLLWLRENAAVETDAHAGGCLIVAPTSLLHNWKAEHDKHLEAPGLGELLQVHGSHIKAARRADGSGLDSDKLRRAAWVLTTYETLKSYQQAFAEVRFRCVVFDEAQKIKSPDTQVTDAAKALKADFKIAMTGTPVENRRADLWCISDAVYGGLLGSLKDFSTAYEKDESVEAAMKLNAMITEGTADSMTPQRFMLRRMKEDILEGLPTKGTETRPCVMPEQQAEAYSQVLDSARGQTQPGAKLKALQALRMVSLHPWLADDAREAQEFDVGGFVAASARLQELYRVLQEVRDKGEKALLFVNSRTMQMWLRTFLNTAMGLADVALINGTTPAAQRQKSVDAFQSAAPGFGLMLLSPKAAGVGLTITAANHVIHLERWWNPAVEDQCTDRAYRIGQNKPVTVWLPQAVHPDTTIAEHSFDLRLHELLGRKRKLSRELLSPSGEEEGDTSQLFDETIGGA